VNVLREREFPSLAKEGCREAAGWFDQEIHYLTNTTPALRATPPLLRRGLYSRLPIHSHLHRLRLQQTLEVGPGGSRIFMNCGYIEALSLTVGAA